MRQTIKIIDNKKPCSICKQNLPIENFRKNKTLVCGLHSQCNECEQKERRKHRKKEIYPGYNVQKKENLKQRFIIELEEYISKIILQNNKCKICGDFEKNIDTKTKNPKKLCVDHDHVTGKIRGLLCDNCNKGLGFFKDNIFLLEKAINYLKDYQN